MISSEVATYFIIVERSYDYFLFLLDNKNHFIALISHRGLSRTFCLLTMWPPLYYKIYIHSKGVATLLLRKQKVREQWWGHQLCIHCTCTHILTLSSKMIILPEQELVVKKSVDVFKRATRACIFSSIEPFLLKSTPLNALSLSRSKLFMFFYQCQYTVLKSNIKYNELKSFTDQI